jgi:F-type H+-transporting ATPase subunit epsilon
MAEARQDGMLAVRLVTPDRVLLGAGEVRLHGGTSGDQKFFVAWGFVEVLPERVTILAETAMHPNEIDRAKAEADLQLGQKMWSEAGDDGAKFDEANEITRKAEEELASADGK